VKVAPDEKEFTVKNTPVALTSALPDVLVVLVVSAVMAVETLCTDCSNTLAKVSDIV
jgi:hypothetical protein